MSSTTGHAGPNQSESLSLVVVTAIADHKGVDPMHLDPPLYEVIDLDALDSLFSCPRDGDAPTTGSLTFSYDGSEVYVASDGTVRVDDSGD